MHMRGLLRPDFFGLQGWGLRMFGFGCLGWTCSQAWKDMVVLEDATATADLAPNTLL